MNFCHFFELLSSSVINLRLRAIHRTRVNLETVTRLSRTILTNNSIPPKIKSVLESMDGRMIARGSFGAKYLRKGDKNGYCEFKGIF